MAMGQIRVASQPGEQAALHLVEEINHRVVNEYTEAVLALSLAASRTRDADAKAMLNLATDRLNAHAAAHRALLAPNVEGLTNLADHLIGVCQSMSKASLAERGIRLQIEADEIWLDAR